jgi:hypothetical protein
VPHSREIRYDLKFTQPLNMLVFNLPFAALGYWMVVSPKNLVAVIAGCLFLIPFGWGTLSSLTLLLSRVIFQRPVIMMNTDGVTYASPSMPWHRIVVPWSDVARLSVVKRVYARSSATYFLTHTRHPERYRSLRARRFRAWWTPALDDATIVVSLSLLAGGTSLAKRQKFMERIDATFAREIGLYGVEVRSLARNA